MRASDEALLGKMMEFYARAVVVGHNKDHPDRPLSLKETKGDGPTIRYLSGDGVFPPGLAPAFALHNGSLLVGSSPEAIRRFGTAAAPLPGPGEPFPLLRVSLKGWRAYLKGRLAPLAELIAQKEQRPVKEVKDDLTKLLAGLELVDRVELRLQATPGQAVLSLHVQTAFPLRK
jgi:hypothetical protein